MLINRLTILCIVMLGFVFQVFSQDEVDPNGYNVFYYPNGFKLSEGNLKDGKPDGYWTTYHVNGNKKAEGNRKNFLLDSTWVFYYQNGDTSEIINYAQDQKNGFYYKYERNDTIKGSFLESKELYVNDKKQGFSYYYYPSRKLKTRVEYVDNYKHGKGYEYTEDGRLIAIEEYRYNNMVSRKAVNRYNNKNEKTGKWVEVFDNGKIKSEINFVSGMPNGASKEYSPTGKILKIDKFENGKIVETFEKPKFDTLESANIKVDKEYYKNGKLKSIKNYKDSLPFGIHVFYNENGTVDKAISYNEFGIKDGEGKLDTLSNKIGEWIFYYDDGKIKAKGNYKKDKREGEWIFYYNSGQIEQKGTYEEGYAEGNWVWYYENGNILRKEEYFLGFRSGKIYEFSPDGDTIVSGNYDEGDKDGKWFYKIGDEYSEGEYYFGQKTGEWETFYYPEMKIKEIVRYSEGKKTGKYKEYYKNKKQKAIGAYASGEKNGKWIYYNEDGSVNYSAVYNYGEISKVNDEQIK